MADPHGARVLRAARRLKAEGFTLTDKYSQVIWVLYRVLVLNLAVAVAKIALGYATGAAHERSECYERPERRERV